MFLQISLGLFLVSEALLLIVAIAAWRARSVDYPGIADKTAVPTTATIIPVLGFPDGLEKCLRSLRDQGVACSEVIVVAQDSEPDRRSANVRRILSLGIATVIELDQRPSKAMAIQLGLSKTKSELTLLLDADTTLAPEAIETLTKAMTGQDAAYGIIAPDTTARPGMLDAIVKLEKLMSHGLWRPGRWSLGLGPNLPGQCYMGRTSVLRDTYTADLGYLDDVALSVRLLAKGARINFVSALIAFESSRSTWTGLLLQRGRYTMGLLQSFAAIRNRGVNRIRAYACLGLHAWLYYISCISAVVLAVTFAALNRWAEATILIAFFIAHRVLLALLATRVLRNFNVQADLFWPSWALLPSIPVLALTKTLGAFLALGLISLRYSGQSIPTLYRR
jgi:cellulose synthase/poly-beta-1,6-N-acetylglucosamine synthase-like glycosyltransferase